MYGRAIGVLIVSRGGTFTTFTVSVAVGVRLALLALSATAARLDVSARVESRRVSCAWSATSGAHVKQPASSKAGSVRAACLNVSELAL